MGCDNFGCRTFLRSRIIGYSNGREFHKAMNKYQQSGVELEENITSKNEISKGENLFKIIIIPDIVKEIKPYQFSGYTEITSITIPNTVTSIGEYAFHYCTGITSITFKGTKKQWHNIKKGICWNFGTGDYTIYCSDGNLLK